MWKYLHDTNNFSVRSIDYLDSLNLSSLIINTCVFNIYLYKEYSCAAMIRQRSMNNRFPIDNSMLEMGGIGNTSSHNRFRKQVSIPQRTAYRVIDRELAIVTSMMEQTTFSLYCRSTRVLHLGNNGRVYKALREKKEEGKESHRCTD